MRRADIFIAIEWAELWPWGIGPKIGLRQDRPQQMCLLAQMKSREETLAMSFDAYRQAHTSIDDFSPSRHTRRLLLTGRSATQHFAVVEWMHFRFLPDVRQQKGGERRRREKRGNKSRSTTTASRVPNRQQDSRTAAGRKMSHADQAAEEHTRTQIMVTAIIIINDAQRKRWSSDPKTAMLVARITPSPLFREHFTTASVSLSSSSGHVQLAFFLSLF